MTYQTEGNGRLPCQLPSLYTEHQPIPENQHNIYMKISNIGILINYIILLYTSQNSIILLINSLNTHISNEKYFQDIPKKIIGTYFGCNTTYTCILIHCTLSCINI